jgi:DNA polymerase-3 subunit epsilon
MKEIVLDTETTGLDPFSGDRLIEIGAIELNNRIITTTKFHVYINPQTTISEGAYRVHGISNAMLADKPLFRDVAQDFLKFIEGSTLIIHNARFDLKFLNYELSLLNLPSIDSANVIDTLLIARNLFPRTKVNLDALCKKFKVDNSDRTFHGALKDAKLLAEVYCHLTGGKQFAFSFENENTAHIESSSDNLASSNNAINNKVIAPTEEELAAHAKFIADLWKTAN